MDEKKKDFITYLAILLSRGYSVAADIIKDYIDGEVIFSISDLDYLKELTTSDEKFAKTGENFIIFLRYLIETEYDFEKKRRLEDLFDTITNLQMGNNIGLSLN